MKKIMILAAIAALAACSSEANKDNLTVTDTGVTVEGPEVGKEPFKEPNNVNDENVKPK